uniref:Helix-turn-helix domain-containing protein n=1 Tax=Steinernema glaseri TaxID=37863 RepID=A0A1I8AJ17_9BILA
MTLESNMISVISLFKLGRSGPDIRRLLKLHRMEVKRVLNRYKQTGSIRNRKRQRFECPVRTSVMIEAVRDRVKRNPNRSMRKMAKELNISGKSMRRVIREDLKM